MPDLDRSSPAGGDTVPRLLFGALRFANVGLQYSLLFGGAGQYLWNTLPYVSRFAPSTIDLGTAHKALVAAYTVAAAKHTFWAFHLGVSVRISGDTDSGHCAKKIDKRVEDGNCHCITGFQLRDAAFPCRRWALCCWSFRRNICRTSKEMVQGMFHLL